MGLFILAVALFFLLVIVRIILMILCSFFFIYFVLTHRHFENSHFLPIFRVLIISQPFSFTWRHIWRHICSTFLHESNTYLMSRHVHYYAPHICISFDVGFSAWRRIHAHFLPPSWIFFPSAYNLVEILAHGFSLFSNQWYFLMQWGSIEKDIKLPFL